MLRVPILMYHRLGGPRPESIVPGHYVPPTLFERQLRLLRLLKTTTVGLDEMQDAFEGRAALPKRPVAITFDDGYESFHTLGVPSLRRMGMSATVFLVSAHLGGKNEWDLAKGDVEEGLMSLVQIRDAEAHGMRFGAHTRHHAELTTLSEEAAQDEIRGSKEDLETALGHSVDYFCYPYGATNDAVRAMVREAGFRGATGTRLHGNDHSTDPFAWGRINVRENTTVLRLLRRVLKCRRR